MELNNNKGDLEREAPNVASAGSANPFTVPGNYFEDLQGQLMGRIKLEHLRSTGFTTPEGYFDNLNDRIIAAAKMDTRRDEIAAGGFDVPGGYFSGLQDKIVSRATVSKPAPAKVIGMRRWWSYAAAACVTAVIGVGIFLNTASNSIDSKLSRIPEDEIVHYLQTHSDTGDFPIILDNMSQNVSSLKVESDLSDEEIEQYLQSTL